MAVQTNVSEKTFKCAKYEYWFRNKQQLSQKVSVSITCKRVNVMYKE